MASGPQYSFTFFFSLLDFIGSLHTHSLSLFSLSLSLARTQTHTSEILQREEYKGKSLFSEGTTQSCDRPLPGTFLGSFLC
ncbi:hypothetical protein BHM03_00035132 [Ensete ventricosum]|nr:hypothetical protein BHM03_00035132 [Ensete ventricosum]